MHPLVSIIVPTFSGTQTLARALESCVGQTFNDLEIIVVDDNGVGTAAQRKSAQIVSRYATHTKVSYIPHKVNMNGAAARNTALRSARGKYIAFLDDDDELTRDSIELRTRWLGAAPRNVFGVFGDYYVCSGRGVKCQEAMLPENDPLVETLSLRFSYGSGSNIFVRSESARQVGGFNESLRRHQDYEFYAKLFRHGTATHIPTPIMITHRAARRNRPSATEFEVTKKEFLELFREDLDRLETASADRIRGAHALELSKYYAREGDLQGCRRCFFQCGGRRVARPRDVIVMLFSLCRHHLRSGFAVAKQ